MKKVLLFAIAIVAVSFASCSSKASTEQPANNDSIEVVAAQETEVIVPDSAAAVATEVVDETAAPAKK